MRYCSNFSGATFLSTEIEITQFPDGFRLRQSYMTCSDCTSSAIAYFYFSVCLIIIFRFFLFVCFIYPEHFNFRLACVQTPPPLKHERVM